MHGPTTHEILKQVYDNYHVYSEGSRQRGIICEAFGCSEGRMCAPESKTHLTVQSLALRVPQYSVAIVQLLLRKDIHELRSSVSSIPIQS